MSQLVEKADEQNVGRKGKYFLLKGGNNNRNYWFQTEVI